MEKKYILTDETMDLWGCILYRIQAVKNFGDVKAGDLGGWIESEWNLSHEGDCWVYDEAKIFGDARVYEDAQIWGKAKAYDIVKIYGNAVVYDNAILRGNARVYGNAQVYRNARVYGNTQIYGNAAVYDNTVVYGNTQIYGHAQVSGDAKIFDEAKVHGYAAIDGHAKLCCDADVFGDDVLIFSIESISKAAYVCSINDVICLGPIGSRQDYTTFYKTKDGSIWVSCGCFTGSIEDFEKAVEKTHGDNLYTKEYYKSIRYARDMLSL